MASAYWCNPGGHAGADHILEVSSAMLKWVLSSALFRKRKRAGALESTSVEYAQRRPSPARGCSRLGTELHGVKNASRERIQVELSNVETVNVSGTHMDFLFTSWERVVAVMRRCLGASAPQQMSDRR